MNITLWEVAWRKFLTKNRGYKHFGYFCLMRLLKRVFDFYLDASIHVAFAVLALIQVTLVTLNIPVDNHCSWFLFFGTIASYNFIKYGVEAEKYFKVANDYHKSIQFFSFIALGLAIYHAYFLNFEVWVGIIVLILLTGLYALPILPKARNLRSLGGLKIFIVAIVWAGTTVILPSLRFENTISWDVWIETSQRFLFVLVLLIPFEIRDLKYDQEDLRTLPQRYGVTRTKTIGAFLVLCFFFFTFLKDDISQVELIGKGTIFLVLGSLMFVTKRNQSTYFASFWVEGIPIIWLLILTCLRQ